MAIEAGSCLQHLSSSFKRVCLVSRENQTVAEGEGGFENGGRPLLNCSRILLSLCEFDQEYWKEATPVFSEVSNHPSAPAKKSLKPGSLLSIDDHNNEVDSGQMMPGDVVDVSRAPLRQVTLSMQTLADVIV